MKKKIIVASLLKYGAKVKETADGAPKTVYFTVSSE